MPTIDLGIVLDVVDKASGKIEAVSGKIGGKLKGALGLATTGFAAAAVGSAVLAKGLFEVAQMGAESAREVVALGEKSGLTAGELKKLTENADAFDASMDLMKGTLTSWASEVTAKVSPVIDSLAHKLRDLKNKWDASGSTPEERAKSRDEEFAREQLAAAEKADEEARKLAEEHAKWVKEREEDDYQRYLEDERKRAKARDDAREAQRKADEAIADRKRFMREAEADLEARLVEAERVAQQRKVDQAISLAQSRFDEDQARHDQRMAMIEAEKQAEAEQARALGFEFYTALQSVVTGVQTADQALLGLGQRLAETLASKLFGIGLDALLGLLGFAVGGPAGAAVGAAVGGVASGIGGGFAEPGGGESRFVGRSSAGLTGRAERPVQILTVVPPTRAQLDRVLRDSVGPSLRRMERD